MNTIDLLVQAADRDPDDLTLEMAIRDALVDLRDMTFPEAEQHAAKVMQSARDARDLFNATQLLHPDHVHREHLLDLMSMTVGCGMDERTCFVIVPGGSLIIVTGSNFNQNTRAWFANTVTVSARWVLDTYRKNLHLFGAPAPKKRRQRKPL